MQFGFVLSLPESPRWLIFKHKDAEARRVLAALHDAPENTPYISIKFSAIKDTVLGMEKGSFKELFINGPDTHFRRTVLAHINQMFQQISGINLITYHIWNVLQEQVGLSPTLAKLIAACNGEYFKASWVPVFTVEKFGRRT